jgi:hypothetical protein
MSIHSLTHWFLSLAKQVLKTIPQLFLIILTLFAKYFEIGWRLQVLMKLHTLVDRFCTVGKIKTVLFKKMVQL